jgi:guanyl-specific ribonuclease Sa
MIRASIKPGARHAYAGNNPITNTDPTGLCSQSGPSWAMVGGCSWQIPESIPSDPDWYTPDSAGAITEELTGYSGSSSGGSGASGGGGSGSGGSSGGGRSSDFIAQTPTKAKVPAGSNNGSTVNWAGILTAAAIAAALLCIAATHGECLELLLANGGDILGTGGEAAGLGAEAASPAAGIASDAAIGELPETEAGAEAGAEEAASTGLQRAQDVLAQVDSKGNTFPGFKGGSNFANDGRAGGQVLPQNTSEGDPIAYREWDVNPSQKGTDRGPERLVTGSDGSAYYSDDHYATFTNIRGANK